LRERGWLVGQNVMIEYRNGGGGAECALAFATARQQRVEALTFGPDTQFLRKHLTEISEPAVTGRLPAMADHDVYSEGGVLTAYGPDLYEPFARAAHHADRIFKGASSAELPVEKPTNYKLVKKLKTAKALGLTVPQALLLRADEVNE